MLVIPLSAAAAGSTPTVAFTGTPLLNLGTLSCPSTPNISHLAVAAGAVVRFTNRTGKKATLHVGGSSQTVQSGDTTPVTFTGASDTVSVTMIPDCLLDVGTHQAMTVDVTAATTVATTAATPPAKTGAHPAAGQQQPAGVTVVKNNTHTPAVRTVQAGVTPGTIGMPPATQVDNRGLVELLIFATGLVAIFAALCAYYMRKIHLRMPPPRQPTGDGPREQIPDATAAKIYDLGRAAERRKAR